MFPVALTHSLLHISEFQVEVTKFMHLEYCEMICLKLQGASYWRVPQELIECWTLEEHSLKGSLQNMSPVRKR